MQKILGIACVGVVVLVGFLFIPITDTYTVRDGTDDFRAHHSLHGVREKSVRATAAAPTNAIGLILVNLRRASALAPVTVDVFNSQGEKVASQTRELPATIDDEFTWFAFDKTIAVEGEEYTITASSPDATVSNPVGLRFDRETKELALSVREKIPVWEKMHRWVTSHEKEFSRTKSIVLYSLGLAALLLALDFCTIKHTFFGTALGLLLLICATLYLRIPLSNSLESAYGGDAFNYILKGNAWIVGADPFAADPRKAPLYSFLTAPGLLPPFDPMLWARGISIASAAATVVLVSLFLLKLKAPLSIALGGALLLSINRDYQFESIQGLSNTLYAAFIIASAYAYFSKKGYLVSLFTALATLTRYEGAAVAGILIPAMWVLSRSKFRTILREAIPFIVLIAIPFSLTLVTGSWGIRTVSDITSDEGLYVAHSWDYFLPSVQAFKIFYGRLWFLSSSVGDVFVLFCIGALVGVIGSWVCKKYRYLQNFLVILPIIITYIFLQGSLFGEGLWGSSGEVKFFIGLLSFLTGFGVASAVFFRFKTFLPIVFMVVVQIAVITAILPKNRYYLQIIPFIAMAIAGAIWLLGGAKKTASSSHVIAVLALCVIISTVYIRGGEALSGQVSDHNEKSADQTVITKAGKYLKTVPGKVGVPENIDIPLRVYIPQDRFVRFTDQTDTVEAQYKKIQELGVRFILQRSDYLYFANLISENPDKFEEIATYTTRWADISATLYRVY